jgi:hypothetical protein
MTSTLQEHRGHGGRTGSIRRTSTVALGACALLFSVLYFASDVVELLQNGFSTGQLWLTLVAEAAVPALVVGVAVVQRPALGRLGELSAGVYAASYIAFTGTVVYALMERTPDYGALSHDLEPLMVLPGAGMVIAGVGFGVATWRAQVLPRWTAIALGTGVVLVAVCQDLPAGLLLAAATVRDLGFAGMGAALLASDRARCSP